jgi:hypothetical protein
MTQTYLVDGYYRVSDSVEAEQLATELATRDNRPVGITQTNTDWREGEYLYLTTYPARRR